MMKLDKYLMTESTLDNLFEKIAKDHLNIDTLRTRNSDEKDFHDVAVWEIKKALQAAYDAGKKGI